MSEPNVSAIKNPARPRMTTRSLTTLASTACLRAFLS